MNATLPAGEVPEAARRAMLTDGKFTLTGLTATAPEGAQPGSVDVTMSIGAGESGDSAAPSAPILVSFRFLLDRLLPVSTGAPAAVADARTFEGIV